MNIDALTTYLALSSGSYNGILRDMYAVYNLGLNPDLHTKIISDRLNNVSEPQLLLTADNEPITTTDGEQLKTRR